MAVDRLDARSKRTQRRSQPPHITLPGVSRVGCGSELAHQDERGDGGEERGFGSGAQGYPRPWWGARIKCA